MRRTYPSIFFRLACPLVMFLILLAGSSQTLRSETSPGIQSVGECSDSPEACKKPVKYLGESDGCACFACEYGKMAQKIMCTKNEADKKTFKLLLPKTRSGD